MMSLIWIFHPDDYDSLGGLIIEHLDRLPQAGDEITTDEGYPPCGREA